MHKWKGRGGKISKQNEKMWENELNEVNYNFTTKQIIYADRDYGW